MMIPALSPPAQCMQAAMAERVVLALALYLLSADHDLFSSADAEALLDLINEYLEDPEGIAPPVSPTL